MEKTVVLIFLGGGAGSVVRYLISVLLASYRFPVATLAVNLLGSLLIGMLIGWIDPVSDSWTKHLFIIGFCGGFTTFSTFSFDVFTMIRNHDTALWGYLLLSILGCVAFTALGYWIVTVVKG